MSEISAVGGVGGVSPYTSSGRIDPYNIYQLNFAALGGEKNVRYDSNFHFKGEIEMSSGTFGIEEYIKKPTKSLTKYFSNYKLVYSMGDDGSSVWESADGTVNRYPDGDSKEREVRAGWEDFAYTDPKNKMFTSTATRKVSIDGEICFEIKIRNRKTDEVVTQYYNEESYMLKREIRDNSGTQTQTDFSDYKDVGNIKMAFKKVTTNLNTLTKQTTTWDKIEIGNYMSESLFMAPEDKNKNTDYSSLASSYQTKSNVDLYG